MILDMSEPVIHQRSPVIGSPYTIKAPPGVEVGEVLTVGANGEVVFAPVGSELPPTDEVPVGYVLAVGADDTLEWVEASSGDAPGPWLDLDLNTGSPAYLGQDTFKPAYRKVGTTVELQGTIDMSSAGSSAGVAGPLPSDCRPVRNVIVATCPNGGYIYVNTDGYLELENNNPGGGSGSTDWYILHGFSTDPEPEA